LEREGNGILLREREWRKLVWEFDHWVRAGLTFRFRLCPSEFKWKLNTTSPLPPRNPIQLKNPLQPYKSPSIIQTQFKASSAHHLTSISILSFWEKEQRGGKKILQTVPIPIINGGGGEKRKENLYNHLIVFFLKERENLRIRFKDLKGEEKVWQKEIKHAKFSRKRKLPFSAPLVSPGVELTWGRKGKKEKIIIGMHFLSPFSSSFWPNDSWECFKGGFALGVLILWVPCSLYYYFLLTFYFTFRFRSKND